MNYVTHTVHSPNLSRRHANQQRPLHVSEGVQGCTPLLGQGRPQASLGRVAKLWMVWVPYTCLLLITIALQTSCASAESIAAFRCASRYTLCAYDRL